ncbi:MAG TPA: ATP-binding protein [Thermoanaerobaculia bacterium]|nr:ATP-binding protein [Thermoanaerobaculia bacterium]
MKDFERLGVFYLGRESQHGRKDPDLVLYDSRDLVTHAVCVGMTGSGKTGLCISLIEEAALDGIPAILIDPKGDLANLLLTFPNLAPEDFRPWINEEDAARKGVSPDEYARLQAQLWKKGLADWGEDGARIAKLRDAAEFAIYTPGSSAGLPVSILRSFAAPPEAARADEELFGERVSTTATGLLALLGVDADPLQSRESILVSSILEAAWKAGEDLDLSSLIARIQKPPMTRIGAVDADTFFPPKERFALAMKLNNLLASPKFASWLEGEPLDIASILRTPEGMPRVSIFSIAHLSDPERMFFVTLLLNEAVGWMRGQSGTTSLRALLYMDEIAGYFPPVAAPPSKGPFLTLLKQGRAFGVGVVVATQNPVDLDYKGLSNAGTWFLGRLQTERDKARVLDGLEGVSAGGGPRFDRGQIEKTLAGLPSRTFLMNDVHEDGPVVFESRWAMSYLRGPLTRAQIKTLMDPVKAERAGSERASRPERSAHPAGSGAASPERPLLPPSIAQYFLPVRGSGDASSISYRAVALGAAEVHFSDAKSGVDSTDAVVVLAPIDDSPEPVRWDGAKPAGMALSDLERDPQPGATFESPASPAFDPKRWEEWSRDFAGWLFRTGRVDLLRSPSAGQISKPGESERDFRARLQQKAREERDAGADALRARYAARLAALQERKRRAEQAVDREKQQATSAGLQTAISIGATVLGALLGRKAVSATNIGRATTAARGAGRTVQQAGDIARAKEDVAAVDAQIAALEAELQAELDQRAAAADPLTEKLEALSVRPKKSDVSVRFVALAWAPFRGAGVGAEPAWE